MMTTLAAFFKADTLANFVGLFVAFFSILTVIYSLGFMKGRPGLGRYYLYILLTFLASLAAVYASNLIRHRAPWVLGGLLLFVLIIWQINKTKTGKYVFDQTKLKLPIFGSLVQKASVARFARTFSTLLDAGVPILQTLVIVKDTSGNEVVARAMVDIHASIREGESIAEPMKKFPVFPPLVVHMIAVGEETGAIDQMLTKVAEAYEREVDNAVDGLTALIEPLLIVFLGILIGFIVIALYMPLFKIGDVIK